MAGKMSKQEAAVQLSLVLLSGQKLSSLEEVKSEGESEQLRGTIGKYFSKY